jgi:DNA-binding HxlR family transcriptional regulator
MTRRSHDQFCGLARAADLVGERWALLVVRGLVLGPKRFTDLEADLPGIGTNTLSARLKELEADGVVRRRVLPPPAASTVYELTEYGRALEPALLALGRWGAVTLGPRRAEQTLRSGWIGVALRAFADPEAARGAHAEIELRLEHGILHSSIADGAVEVADGGAAEPQLVIEAGNEAFLALLSGAATPQALIEEDALRLEGDARQLAIFLDVFRFRPERPSWRASGDPDVLRGTITQSAR